ncbi:hypothetical protein HPB48_006332 [Haemaphysalis longicornis]|uniref:Uncharacterized protein n=1 Tax=Haemaphysalis longicornis TaxID=44386 RepID=A0A9J6FF32_HAELO|nr:hypothetical protein HPB48_006332 [Haemaphysalis longicornis]
MASDIVDSVVIPYALDGPFADGLYYLQQDRSLIHMARSVKHLLDERGVMATAGPRDALWQAVEEERQRLRATDFAARLFESIPRHVAACVSAKGDFTKY